MVRGWHTYEHVQHLAAVVIAVVSNPAVSALGKARPYSCMQLVVLSWTRENEVPEISPLDHIPAWDFWVFPVINSKAPERQIHSHVFHGGMPDALPHLLITGVLHRLILQQKDRVGDRLFQGGGSRRARIQHLLCLLVGARRLLGTYAFTVAAYGQVKSAATLT